MGGGYEILRQFGLGVFLSVAILAMTWYLLKKIFDIHAAQLRDIDEDRKEERSMWRDAMNKHFQGQEEAHKYQRMEHEQILNNLLKLNGKT